MDNIDKRNFIKGIAAVTVCMALLSGIPYLVYILANAASEEAVYAYSPGYSDDSAYSEPAEDSLKPLERIIIGDGGAELSPEEYIERAVLGSLPPDAEPELIKAQSVLVYTFLLGQNQSKGENGALIIKSEQLNGQFTYLATEAELEAAYGGDEAGKGLEEFYSAVREAVKATKGEYLSFEGVPILPAYCYSSGGVTESAEDIIGESLPYLKSVESLEDSEYITEAVYTSDELFSIFAMAESPITLEGDPSDWIKILDITGTGYVKLAKVGEYSYFTGAELSKMLSLPSARFEISYSSELDRFSFRVSGSGGLMGLSHYGANKMAGEGMSYKELLLYFFPGTSIDVF